MKNSEISIKIYVLLYIFLWSQNGEVSEPLSSN